MRDERRGHCCECVGVIQMTRWRIVINALPCALRKECTNLGKIINYQTKALAIFVEFTILK
jgi:hypothetical protein